MKFNSRKIKFRNTSETIRRERERGNEYEKNKRMEETEE
jgi:hypothetical protein